MIYTLYETIPQNTPIAQPLSYTLTVHSGVVQKVFIRWRYGSGRFCGCRILHGRFQLYPLTLGEWFISSPYPLEFEDDYVIASEPFSFTVEAYNTDAIYPHTLWVGIVIIEKPFAEVSVSKYSIWD